MTHHRLAMAVHPFDAEAARWTQLCRRFGLPREPSRALILAVRNGADADSFVAEGRTHLLVHLAGHTVADALCAESLARAGFAYDGETGAWRFDHGARKRRA
jgi:hypothetical protein